MYQLSIIAWSFRTSPVNRMQALPGWFHFEYIQKYKMKANFFTFQF